MLGTRRPCLTCNAPTGLRQDVDHTINLQVGGSDDLSNMRPLDASVNRSLGIQVAAQLRNLAVGTVITAAAIC